MYVWDISQNGANVGVFRPVILFASIEKQKGCFWTLSSKKKHKILGRYICALRANIIPKKFSFPK